jgi:hypothetical protein
MLRRKLSTCLMGAAVVLTTPDGQASATAAPTPALQSTVSDRLQDRSGCSDQSGRNAWRYGEPTLGDMLDDPILHLLMKRDGVSREFLENLVRAAQCGMTGTS